MKKYILIQLWIAIIAGVVLTIYGCILITRGQMVDSIFRMAFFCLVGAALMGVIYLIKFKT